MKVILEDINVKSLDEDALLNKNELRRKIHIFSFVLIEREKLCYLFYFL